MKYLDVFCSTYLDDILIYSNSRKEHTQHVWKVLQKLHEVELQVDINKCEFHITETKFLDLIITTKGIKMDPTKVQAILEWEKPRSIKDAQAFLGLCNFYCRFIRDFARVARPLHQLTKKGLTFSWTDECERSFNALKVMVTQAPVLRHFDHSMSAHLEADSSDYATGGVLSQKDENGVLHPVAFFSKNLSPTECNYHIYDKELLAIIRCLE